VGVFSVVEATGEAMMQEAYAIEGLNKDQLLNAKDSNDNIVGRYRSPAYAEYKAQLNPKAGDYNVDLKLRGDFYSGFKLTVNGASYTITSLDWKTDKLKKKYGNYIFGLTPENRILAWRKFLRLPVVIKLATQTGCGWH